MTEIEKERFLYALTLVDLAVIPCLAKAWYMDLPETFGETYLGHYDPEIATYIGLMD